MNHKIGVVQRPSWARPSTGRAALAVIVAVVVASLAAACSPTPASSDGVVSLDSPGGNGSPGPSAAPSASDDVAQLLLEYSQCMRDHGVPNFPDPPVSGGQVSLHHLLEGTGIDPSSATFRAADTACQSFMPTPPPEARQPMSAQDQAKWLQFAACIRQHGVPNWPDPDFSNGGPKPSFDLIAAGVHPSTAVDAAQQACRSLLPEIAGSAGNVSSSSPAASPSPTSQI